MKFSVIQDDGKIRCFETKKEAIAYAKKMNARTYDMFGQVIYGQLFFNMRRKTNGM